MGKQDFDRYLQTARLADADQEDRIDWQAEKIFWLTMLDDLYNNVESWLREYIDQGSVSLDFRTIELNEDEIGRYPARQAIVTMGHQMITLTPIGTSLVGTKGRVDLIGPAATIRLVLGGKNSLGPRVVYRKRIFKSTQAEAHALELLEPLGVMNADWVWKISTNPPRISYQDLSADTFFDALLRVING